MYKDLSKEDLLKVLEKLEQEKEENKKKTNTYTVKYLKENQNRRLLSSAKHRAKLQGLEFNLSLTDVVIPKYCPYLEIELTNYFGEGKGRMYSNASLDRIDPSKGYVKGNVQVISDLANKMKSNSTLEQLLMFAKNVFQLHGN